MKEQTFEIEKSDGTVEQITVDVPDGMSDENVLSWLSSQMEGKTQSNSEIPQADEIGLPFAPKDKAGASFSEMADGAQDASRTLLSGLPAGAIGYPAGILMQLSREIAEGNLGSQESAQRVYDYATQFMQGGIVEPKTEIGQNIVQSVGEASEMLTPVAPQLANFQMMRPNLPKMPSKNEIIKSELAKGSVDHSTAPYMLADKKSGQVDFGGQTKEIAISERPFRLEDMSKVKNPAYKPLIKQGFNEGMIPVVREASLSTNEIMSKMVGTAKKMMSNDMDKMMSSPLDHVGEALFKRFENANKQNKQARIEVRKAALGLKGTMIDSNDLAQVTDSIFSHIEDLGAVVDTSKGVKIIYPKGSAIASPMLKKVRASIDEFVDTLKFDEDTASLGGVDGFRLHQLKKTLDEAINFDDKASPKIAGSVERMVKDARAAINQVLRGKSEDYVKANDKAFDTFSLMDDMNKILRETQDLSDPRINQKMGLQMRKLNSNYASKNNILNLIKRAETVTRKYGANYNDDILALASFGASLGRRFRLDGDNTFKALTAQAQVDSVTQMAIKKGWEGISKRRVNDNKAFDEINRYLNDLIEAKK